MSLPLIICDDSSMSRKMIMRALPEDWDVTITQASNGREGLEAVLSGLGKVMFLDLTMPEMDGYEVLEILKKEQIRIKVFVISADIQTEALERVRSLGALDFIKKPITAENLRQVLQQHGVL